MDVTTLQTQLTRIYASRIESELNKVRLNYTISFLKKLEKLPYLERDDDGNADGDGGGEMKLPMLILPLLLVVIQLRRPLLLLLHQQSLISFPNTFPHHSTHFPILTCFVFRICLQLCVRISRNISGVDRKYTISRR